MKMILKESPGFTALSLLLLCLLVGRQAFGATHPPTASELQQQVQGTWEGVMVGHEKDGKITILINGNSLHFHRDTNFWFETTFTLPGGTDPEQLHATIKDSPDKKSSGQVVSAILKIEDGTLTLATIPPPDSAPETPINFDTESVMSGNFYRLRKIQPPEKNAESPASKVTALETSQGRRNPGQAPTREPVDPFFVETTNTVSKQGPRSITRNILQDKKGNIWLASWEGVIRYDGKSFYNETLINNLKKFHVFSLLEDSKGNIWIGTIRGGAYRYDGSNYTYYTTTDGLIDNIIGCLAEDKDGNVWFGTDGGVSSFDGKRFTNYSMTDGLAGNSVNWIMQDKAGLLWFATRSGVSKFDGKSFTNFKTAAGKDFDNVRTVIEDRAGDIWIGGNDGLIRYRNGKLETLKSNFIGYLHEDKSGNLWISHRNVPTAGENWALSKYDGKAFEAVIDVGDPCVFGIYEDKVGNIWYGTMGGVCMLEKGKDRHVGGTRLSLGLPR